VPLTAFDLEVLRRTAGASSDKGGNDGSSDSGNSDASMDETSTGDDSSESGGEADCHVTVGTGATRQCSYSSSCSSLAGSTPGSCPSPDLAGCCVVTRPGDGGGPTRTATCYYSASTGAEAGAGCEFEAYQDPGVYTWQTSPP
jgi:hypothetical protein